ncbi:hypothetical protein Tco_0106841, partial [Tanacetum coccineum]
SKRKDLQGIHRETKRDDRNKIFPAATPDSMDMSNIARNSQKRTRERKSDQEAKEIKAKVKEIMPQPSTVNCS